MKPIVIYLDKKDSVTISKAEFEKYLKEAYDSGYSEGYAAGNRYYYPWWNTSPTITNVSQTNPEPLKITWDTGTQPDYTPHITCDGVNDLNSTFAPGSKTTATNLFYPGDNAVEKIQGTVSKTLKELGEKR